MDDVLGFGSKADQRN